MFKNRLLMLIAVLFIITTFVLLIFMSILKKKEPEKEMYYEIAEKEALRIGFALKDSQMLLDKSNVEWSTILKDMRISNPDYAKRFDILSGKNYVTVKFYPKSKYTVGGVLRVFIDIETKDVITFYGEM